MLPILRKFLFRSFQSYQNVTKVICNTEICAPFSIHRFSQWHASKVFPFTKTRSTLLFMLNTYHRKFSTGSVPPAAKVLVPIASGCEDIEIVSIVDTLRRAGATVNVVLASSRDLSARDPLVITAMNGMKMVAEMHIEDVHRDEFDMIVVPGGIPGAEHLSNCKILISMLRKHKEKGGLYAAICASPKLVLEAHGLLDVSETEKMPATSYPAPPFVMENDVRDRVVVNGKCTTSQGPGTAIEFALTLVKQLYGSERAETVKNELVAR